MISLQNHEEFETLLLTKYPIAIIKFGATWCGPCKRIDKDMLLGLSEHIVWYDCDLDKNEDTPAYCGVSSIPCFLAIVNVINDNNNNESNIITIGDFIFSFSFS